MQCGANTGDQVANGTRGDAAATRSAKVMCLTDRQRGELNCALARVPPGAHPDADAERQLLQILKDLPPDRAWWVSHLVVRYEDHQFQVSKSRSTECRLDQSIDMAIQIPDTILRAAARMESCGM